MNCGSWRAPEGGPREGGHRVSGPRRGAHAAENGIAAHAAVVPPAIPSGKRQPTRCATLSALPTAQVIELGIANLS